MVFDFVSTSGHMFSNMQAWRIALCAKVELIKGLDIEDFLKIAFLNFPVLALLFWWEALPHSHYSWRRNVAPSPCCFSTDEQQCGQNDWRDAWGECWLGD